MMAKRIFKTEADVRTFIELGPNAVALLDKTPGSGEMIQSGFSTYNHSFDDILSWIDDHGGVMFVECEMQMEGVPRRGLKLKNLNHHQRTCFQKMMA